MSTKLIHVVILTAVGLFAGCKTSQNLSTTKADAAKGPAWTLWDFDAKTPETQQYDYGYFNDMLQELNKLGHFKPENRICFRLIRDANLPDDKAYLPSNMRVAFFNCATNGNASLSLLNIKTTIADKDGDRAMVMYVTDGSTEIPVGSFNLYRKANNAEIAKDAFIVEKICSGEYKDNCTVSIDDKGQVNFRFFKTVVISRPAPVTRFELPSISGGYSYGY